MKKIITNECGATAIEYAFICALVVLVAIAGMSTLGERSTNQISNVSAEVSNAIK